MITTSSEYIFTRLKVGDAFVNYVTWFLSLFFCTLDMKFELKIERYKITLKPKNTRVKWLHFNESDWGKIQTWSQVMKCLPCGFYVCCFFVKIPCLDSAWKSAKTKKLFRVIECHTLFNNHSDAMTRNFTFFMKIYNWKFYSKILFIFRQLT